MLYHHTRHERAIIAGRECGFYERSFPRRYQFRANGWTVNTQHQGAMRIGGKTVDQVPAIGLVDVRWNVQFSTVVVSGVL